MDLCGIWCYSSYRGDVRMRGRDLTTSASPNAIFIVVKKLVKYISKGWISTSYKGDTIDDIIITTPMHFTVFVLLDHINRTP